MISKHIATIRRKKNGTQNTGMPSFGPMENKFIFLLYDNVKLGRKSKLMEMSNAVVDIMRRQ